MTLRDLDTSLYDRNSSVERKRKRYSHMNPEHRGILGDAPDYTDAPSELTAEGRDSATKIRRNSLVIGGLVVAILAGVVALVWGLVSWRASAFSADRVEFTIESPEGIMHNTQSTFVFHYANNNRTALDGAYIEIDYPDTFVPGVQRNFQKEGVQRGRIDLGRVEPGGSASVSFGGQFVGVKASSDSVRARLVYIPEGFTSRLTLEAQTIVDVSSSSLDLEVIAPIEVGSGSSVEYLVRYSNLGTDDLYGTQLRVDFPIGFTFHSAEPTPSKGTTIWRLDNLSAGSSGVVKIRGAIDVSDGNTVTVGATVGVERGSGDFDIYSTAQGQTKIITSPLHIAQTANTQKDVAVSPGGTVHFQLKFENRGDTGLRDIIIEEQFDGDVFDLAGAQLQRGYVDVAAKTITWRASDVPELALLKPGQSGSIGFSVPIKKSFPIRSEVDKNFTGSSTVTIDSRDIPNRVGVARVVGTDSVTFRVNSQIDSQQSFFDATTGTPVNAMVATVGKENIFEIHWSISNLYNDISDAQASFTLPSGIVWKEVVSEDSVVAWNDRTQSLVWDIGKMPAGTGVITPKRTLVFRVAVTPQEHQKNQTITLVQGMQFHSRDTFTQERLELQVPDNKASVQMAP